MPLSVDGNAMTDARLVFDALGQAKFQDYSNRIRNNRLASTNIAEVLQERSIGTVDATSCISVCYLNTKHIALHHHDIEERQLEKIAQIFKDYFLETECNIFTSFFIPYQKLSCTEGYKRILTSTQGVF